MSPAPLRAELEAVFRAALRAVDPGRAVRAAARELPADAPWVVLAAGKAAAAMAKGLEEEAGDRIRDGLVVTKDGHALPLRRCRVLEAGHPVPDARSERAARELLRRAAAAPSDAVVVVLLSGGASALLTAPLPGLALADLAATTALLLESGADIDELNTVRRHVAAATGGRLALAAAPRRVEVLAVSDVPGDRLEVLASGPCAPDATTYADAWGILERRVGRASLPPAVVEHFEAGLRGEREESLPAGHPAFERVRTRIVASLATALAAARDEAEARGMRAVVLTDSLRGEARTAGRRLAGLARACTRGADRCLLAGGETTVTVRGPGRGGRNQELALAAALELSGSDGIGLLAAGSDGTDGPTDAAGAFVDGGTVARGERAGVSAAASLARNDSYGFFDREGGILRTGPTRTNVTDLALVGVSAGP